MHRSMAKVTTRAPEKCVYLKIYDVRQLIDSGSQTASLVSIVVGVTPFTVQRSQGWPRFVWIFSLVSQPLSNDQTLTVKSVMFLNLQMLFATSVCSRLRNDRHFPPQRSVPSSGSYRIWPLGV